MKIVAGLGSVEDYVRFVDAGADEFFCGYVPYRWVKKYGVLLPLNRREVLYYNVQIGSITELKILKKMVDQYGVPVKITFNSLYYIKEQYSMIAEIMKECMEVGFDTFIIADVALILYLRKHNINCKIHLSGETAEVNHLMLDVLSELKFTRIIFHRKNSIKDMKACITHQSEKTMEYEAFVLNEWCHFTGAFCNSLHCDEMTHLCKVPYQMARIESGRGRFEEVNQKFLVNGLEGDSVDESQRSLEEDREEEVLENQEEWQDFVHQDGKEEQDLEEDEESEQYLTGSTGCGLCALQQLKAAGITHLKLVGRGNYVDSMEKDIKQLRKAIELLDTIDHGLNYKEKMRQELFQGDCSGVCYYNNLEM